ncbi:MAG: tyrosine--tRNA ligase [Vicinamibacterales bacterium]
MSDLFSELQWRGLVYDSTQGAKDLLTREKVTAYSGFDPTASSLHVGSLMQMMTLARLQRAGHSPIALVGGGTGLIGDPSGKTVERTLQSKDEVEANVRGIRSQLERFLDFNASSNPARLVDNGEWLNSMSAMEFLRDVGKYFTVNYLMAKESVKRRLESEEGISYTEFSYSLLQAYDFLVLHDRHNCRLQIGGSDQWGNIVAGADLIRKLRGMQAHGVVTPLLTTSSGTKFGKTETGTVWLDAARTSPFRFYQFWLNSEDRDVVMYLKFFTFRSQDEIAALELETREHPERRAAQRSLARELTAMVHGDDHVARAERAAAVLFGGSLSGATKDDILMVFDDAPSVSITGSSLESGIGAADLAVKAGLAASKGEAGRLIKQGGLYVNDRRLTDERGQITMADAIERSVIVLRKGQRERRIVRIEA